MLQRLYWGQRNRVAAFAFLLLAVFPLQSQTAIGTVPLTLRQAVEAGLRNYPSIQVSQEQLNAAAAGIQLARTAYLPHLDTELQINRATRNNVFGLLLPQSTIPSISGPVLGTNNLGTAWNSAAGILVTWEPFDFGLRRANEDVATKARAQAEAASKLTQFDIATATADTYLTLAAANETVQAAQAGVQRAEVVLKITKALVEVELRPGADASRAEAELAAARIQLIRAEQADNIARANLSRFVEVDPAQITLSKARLEEMPPETKSTPPNTGIHPAAAQQNAVLEEAKAQLRMLERSYFPRFYLQGAAYARGTGAQVDGRLLSGWNGLAPNTQNYALGLTIVFPVLDRPAIQARESAQLATVRAETARAHQIAVDLQAQWNAAVATVEGARKIAANAPVQVAAARAASQQAKARYEAGLGNIEEVAEADRLLTQAEIDNALARLGTWRGLLGVAAAAGDIRPLLSEASE